MYKISKILLLFLLFSSTLLIDECNCARILFTGAVDSGTHIASMVPLIKRLASSGNQITVLELATLDQPRSLGPNVSVHFIPVPVDKGIATKLAAEMFRIALNGRSLQLQYQLDNDKFAEFMQTHTNVFVNLLNQKFDLIILDEIFGVHSYAIALHFHRFHSVPYAIYSTTMMIQSTAFSLGLGRNFVSEPNLLTSPPANSNDFYRPTNLLNRLDNLQTIAWDLFRVNWQTEWLLDGPKSSLKLLAIPRFSFQQLFGQSSFFFVDYLDRVPAPLPEAIDLLPISANCPSIRPLPLDLAKFVEDPSSAGTIFVAFGTNVHWRFAPSEMVRAFFLVLNRLRPYRIIFSFNGNIPEGIILGEHFKVVNWAPQFDILAHPKTKLFISHGGLKSFKETLCAKIPAVYMPIYAEQSYNTKIALRIGFGTAISKYSMNEGKLENAIQMILQNYEHFKENAKRANAFFLDRPLDGMGMAEFGINRAIKEGVEGQKRRRKWRKRKAMAMGIFETANIDLGLAILALILALIG